MSRGTRFTAALRSLAVLSLGALAVHQLRYLAGYGGDAGPALAHQGHGYMGGVPAVLGALGFAAVLATILAGRFGAPGRRPAHPLTRICAYAGVLLATYATQELLEGALSPGHPAGFVGLFGHGGWTAIPLALLFGVFTWLAVRGLEAVEERIAARRPRAPLARAPRALGSARPAAAPLLQSLTLGFGFSRRPPPALTA
ncbi:MAG: hypothetical protein QOD60_356 [Solirubrobacterales bacterium]|jgi:hypothetical protein|nr:hypothetical protein [Solirubrobacterales bacterium]